MVKMTIFSIVSDFMRLALLYLETPSKLFQVVYFSRYLSFCVAHLIENALESRNVLPFFSKRIYFTKITVTPVLVNQIQPGFLHCVPQNAD